LTFIFLYNIIRKIIVLYRREKMELPETSNVSSSAEEGLFLWDDGYEEISPEDHQKIIERFVTAGMEASKNGVWFGN